MRKNKIVLKSERTVSLTLKDRLVLRELFNNARQSFAVIGKNTRLSKEVVNYRLKRLMRAGVVTGFNTVINVRKLGWSIFLVFIRLRNIDIAQENTIINFLVNHPHVAWLVECMGNYDLVLKLFAEDNSSADAIMKEIEDRFKPQIDEYTINSVVEERAVPFAFLYQKKEGLWADRPEINVSSKVALSTDDMLMLKQLARHARMSLTDIAINLGFSRDVLYHRLRKLEREKTIITYRPDVHPEKLGYNWYLIVLKFGKIEKKKADMLKQLLNEHPNVTYLYHTIGGNDIAIEARAKTHTELNNVLVQVRSLLKETLKWHEVLIILQEHKYTYFPDCLLKTP